MIALSNLLIKIEQYIEKQFTFLPATVEEVEEASFWKFVRWLPPFFKISFAVLLSSFFRRFISEAKNEQANNETRS